MSSWPAATTNGSSYSTVKLLKRSAAWRLVKDDGLGILFERRTPVLMKSEVSAERSNSISQVSAAMSKMTSRKVETGSTAASGDAAHGYLRPMRLREAE
jgi:hypothetical protein